MSLLRSSWPGVRADWALGGDVSRHPVLSEISGRIRDYVQTGNPAGILDAEILNQAHLAVRQLSEGAGDKPSVEIVFQTTCAVGWLCWCRYMALPDGEDEPDFNRAVALFATLYRRAPAMVPEQLRPVLLEIALQGASTDSAFASEVGSVDHYGAPDSGEDTKAAELDHEIGRFRSGLAFLPDDHLDRARILAALAQRLRERFERIGRRSDLDEAISRGREALAATPLGNQDRGLRLSGLAGALATRFSHFGDARDIDEAIGLGDEAVVTTTSGSPERAVASSNQVMTLLRHFELTGEAADLQKAIALGREAVSGNGPDQPLYLSNLAGVLMTRYTRAGSLDDLDEAIQLTRRAITAMAADRHEKAGMLSNLASMLGERFGRIGAIRDLDEAVDAAREAVAKTPDNDPNRPMFLSNLGAILSSRFERVGKAADLDEKIDVGRAAVKSTASRHPNWPLYLGNLSQGLRARYILRGDPADLTEAISVLRDAVAATPEGHPDLPGLSSALAGALHSQFEQSDSDAALTEAIMLGRMAVSATPRDDPDRAMYLSGLAGALWSQSARTGLAADLDDAIAAIEGAVALTPGNHPDLGLLLSNHGQALRTRFDQSGDPADLDQAVSIGRRAVAVTPEDHPDRAPRLFVHANSLRARFVLAGDDTDLNEAVAEFRQASQTPDAAAGIRIRSAHAWGTVVAESGRDWALAAEGFAAAVRLMPLLAWRGLDRPEQQNQLAMCAGVPEDAAACAVASGQLHTAIELLEQGRSILWGQALQTRSELSSLRDAHPRLAERMENIRAELEDAAISSKPQLNRAAELTSRVDGRQRERRMRAARQWDETLAEVRRQHGFTRFLLPEPYDVLKQAAADGPVVIVNVSRYRCDALAVTSSEVKLIPLPALTHQDVIEHAGRYIAALLYMSAPRAPAKNRPEGRQIIMAVLEWLWDAASQHVLEGLGYTLAEQAGTPLPRIWWCPTGPLSLLPLHAAGYHDRDDEAPLAGARLIRSVLDRLVSSYTPTLGALVRARDRPPAPQQQQRLLIAAVPAAQGYRPLPGAEAEAHLVASRARCPYTLLDGKKATRQAVLRALAWHAYAHFACHGGLDISDPSGSGICLSDGLLTVSDIAGLRLEHAELVYLAACQTAAATGPWADEAIHLAAALQIVGYRHVIATLWSVGDQTAPDIADRLYTSLRRNQELDVQHTAVALHDAIQRLRSRFPADPTMWAHYVHFGP